MSNTFGYYKLLIQPQSEKFAEVSRSIRSRKFYKTENPSFAITPARVIDKVVFPEISDIEKKLKEKHPHFNRFNYDESDLFSGSQPWIGLNQQVLQTPYAQLLNLFEFLEGKYSINTIVDIGAAYGRAAFVKSSVFPKAIFVGYEIVKERAKYANKIIKKFDIRNSILIADSVFEARLINADIYILYDFSNESDIHHLLEILSLRAEEGLDFLIAVKGKSTPKILEDHFTNFNSVKTSMGDGGFSLYSSAA